MTTLNTTAQKETEELVFLRRQVRKVAWRRVWGLAVALGVFGTVAASDKLDTTAEAFGYAVGFGGTALVMGAGTTIICGKGRKD